MRGFLRRLETERARLGVPGEAADVTVKVDSRRRPIREDPKPHVNRGVACVAHNIM